MSEKQDIYVLGIETSCDETAASVVKNGNEIISNVVASQIESHKRFGGVVPEIASRHHVEQITLVIEEALSKAEMGFDDLDAIAVTEGPGLVGALLIGVNAAKALSFAHQIPLVGVHHIAPYLCKQADRRASIPGACFGCVRRTYGIGLYERARFIRGYR